MHYLEEGKRVWAIELVESQTLSRALGIGLFILLTSLGAFIRIPIPFTPVPITMQTFFILLSGLFLRRYDGSISQSIYLLLGLIGLPIFAGATSGVSVLLGPTGGYLIGFLIAPSLVNLIYTTFKTSNAQLRSIIALAGGALVIHLLGVINLAHFLNTNLLRAFILGSLPFLVGALLKIIVGTQIFLAYKKILGRN